MKNILYHYSSQQIHTGSPRVLMGIIEGLDRSSFTPFFLAGREGDLSSELVKRGCVVLRGESGQISFESAPRNVVNISRLCRLLRRNDIALVHMNELGWNSEAALAARLVGIPVLFHVHNPEKMTRRNINCRIGSRFIFVSQALAESCCDSAYQEKAQVLYNPIAVERFAGGRPMRAALGLTEGVPVVGTVAQISKRKGIDVVIETARLVLREIPEARFAIVGPDAIGEEVFASEMRHTVEASGLRDNVIFLGPRDDVPDFLASIDIFFLPARSEPFGMVFAEAMAAKVPVVASRVGGIPEIIPSQEFGFTLDLDAESFARTIIGLFRDRNLMAAVAEAGHRRAREHFDALVFHRKLKELYREVLALKETSSPRRISP